MSEETTEEEMSIEEKMSEDEEFIAALAQMLNPKFEAMEKSIEELKENFSKTEQKVETFASAPAAERTKAEITNRNFTKKSVDYKPLDDAKKAQFERLLKIRNKK